MRSRESILAEVSQNQPELLPLPTIPAGKPADELISAFQQRLEAIGGQLMRADTLTDIANWLLRKGEPGVIVTNVPDLDYGSRVPPNEIDGHQFSVVAQAVLTGAFGVAENGAVWVDGRTLPHRALPFICQHLVLVVPASTLVPTMHEAYQQLEDTDFDYGVFIAGPSKTADIEQSLVIGAHGARSLIVFLLADTH